MAWLDIYVNKEIFRCLMTKIEKGRAKFKDCDEQGRPVTKEYTPAKTKYSDVDGNVLMRDEIFKLIKDKARARTKQTKIIKNPELVLASEMEDFIVEGYYLLECEGFNEHLKSTGKVIKTAYTSGNGYKVYEAFIMPFRDEVIMVLGLGRLTDEIKNITAGRLSPEKKRQIMENSNVPRMKEEELLNDLCD